MYPHPPYTTRSHPSAGSMKIYFRFVMSCSAWKWNLGRRWKSKKRIYLQLFYTLTFVSCISEEKHTNANSDKQYRQIFLFTKATNYFMHIFFVSYIHLKLHVQFVLRFDLFSIVCIFVCLLLFPHSHRVQFWHTSRRPVFTTRDSSPSHNTRSCSPRLSSSCHPHSGHEQSSSSTAWFSL